MLGVMIPMVGFGFVAGEVGFLDQVSDYPFFFPLSWVCIPAWTHP
jgi:hypothetical protein